MKLIFLGTRGNIEVRTPVHRCHSALMIAHNRKQVMIDCGSDWKGKLRSLFPDAIVLTHAHPDHVLGLEEGAACPVFASEQVWSDIEAFPILDRRRVAPRNDFDVAGLRFEAFPVAHSLRAPAVGYRVEAGGVRFFYVPDVIEIEDRKNALSGLSLYIGDAARLTRPLIRHSDDQPVGHTSVRTQLGWCEDSGIGRAIFTHCGSEVVRSDPASVDERVASMGAEHNIAARLAFDGLQVSLS